MRTSPIPLSAALSAALCTLLAACGPNPVPGNDIGALRARVEAGPEGPELSRVHLEVTPTGAAGDLTFVPASKSWIGTFTVLTGAKTVTATAYTEEDGVEVEVGSASVNVTVFQHQTTTVAIVILDATTRPDGADHGPIVTWVTASNAAPEANDEIVVAAGAVDPDGTPVSIAWTDDCGGTFEDAASDVTQWSNPEVEACALTATASSNGLSHSLSVGVTTQHPTGDVEVEVEFVPAPYVASVSLAGAPFAPSCEIARTDADASCRPAVDGGSSFDVAVTFDPIPADANAEVALADDCGGQALDPVIDLEQGLATFTWTAPLSDASCLLTATVTREETLVDALTVGLAVVGQPR